MCARLICAVSHITSVGAAPDPEAAAGAGAGKRFCVRCRTEKVCCCGEPNRAEGHYQAGTGVADMLETIAIVLLILWALGLVSSYTMGGLIHLLLVVAVIVLLIRVMQGRRI